MSAAAALILQYLRYLRLFALNMPIIATFVIIVFAIWLNEPILWAYNEKTLCCQGPQESFDTKFSHATCLQQMLNKYQQG